MRGSFSSIRLVCFFRQKTAYGQRISDWSSDVCSSDLRLACCELQPEPAAALKALLRSDPRVGVHQRDGYRSEERRVGKECVRTFRHRWPPTRQKQNRKTSSYMFFMST